jgi:hypothetical protein
MDQCLDSLLIAATAGGFIIMAVRHLLQNQRSCSRPAQLVDGTYWGRYPSDPRPLSRPTVDLPTISTRHRDFADEVPRVGH